MSLSVAEQVRWWLIGLALLIAFTWFLSDSLLPYLAGAALAYFLDPIADRLERAGLGRIAATTVITLIMATVFLAFLLLVVPALLGQLRDLVGQIPAYVEQARGFFDQRFPDQIRPGSMLDTALASLRENIKSWSVTLVQSAWSGGLALIDFVMLLVITPVVAFYLLLDWDRMIAHIDNWAPRDHLPVIRKLAREVNAALAGFVRGQLTVCGILGAFYALALMAVGLEFGLMIGLFAGLISFIPFIGSILGGLLSIGVALFQFWGEPVWIAAVAAIFLIGQAVEGNFLTPRLVGGSVGLHPVWLMFALSAFGSLMGFTGMLVAVPTAACIGVFSRFALAQYMAGPLYKGAIGRRIEARPAADPPDGAGGAS